MYRKQLFGRQEGDERITKMNLKEVVRMRGAWGYVRIMSNCEYQYYWC
jgi:hypothetical protein